MDIFGAQMDTFGAQTDGTQTADTFKIPRLWLFIFITITRALLFYYSIFFY